jgi:hypothetical protein
LEPKDKIRRHGAFAFEALAQLANDMYGVGIAAAIPAGEQFVAGVVTAHEFRVQRHEALVARDEIRTPRQHCLRNFFFNRFELDHRPGSFMSHRCVILLEYSRGITSRGVTRCRIVY